jgi:Holliday junction resolvase RusA-like endonuclease
MKMFIKPLSVNEAWQGKRYKTPEYKSYEKTLLLTLPKMQIPQGKLKVSFVFGFSNSGSDIDNPLKLLIDIFQKKYGFNDKDIFEMNIKKVPTKKGQEFFEFEITAL